MAIEPAGFSQPQGISPDGEIMQPQLVADVLVAVPPPLFGAQAQQSPERVSPGAVPHSAAAASIAFAHAHSIPISHDDVARPLSAQDDGADYSANFGFGCVGLQGTRPHQGPLTNRDREVEMSEALDASRGLNAQGHSDSGRGPEVDTSGTYSTPEP